MTIASVATASAVVASPSIAAKIPSLPITETVRNILEEDPRIVELGEKIASLLQAYRTLTAQETEAYATFERVRPALPDDLIATVDKYPALRDCFVEEFYGRGFVEPATAIGGDGKTYAKPPRRVLDSKRLRIHIIEYDIGRTTKRDREIRRLARLAMNYERATQDAWEGVHNIENERRWAAHDLEHLAYGLRKLEPKTIAGVLIFAQALSAFEEAERCAGKIIGGSAQILGPKLAAAILRLGGRQEHSVLSAESFSHAATGGAV